MVYKFLILSDEVDNFQREIEIDSEATFLQFHEAIQESAGYDKKQITSFLSVATTGKKSRKSRSSTWAQTPKPTPI